MKSNISCKNWIMEQAPYTILPGCHKGGAGAIIVFLLALISSSFVMCGDIYITIMPNVSRQSNSALKSEMNNTDVRIDVTYFCVYGILILGIAIYCAFRINAADDYLIAHRNVDFRVIVGTMVLPD